MQQCLHAAVLHVYLFASLLYPHFPTYQLFIPQQQRFVRVDSSFAVSTVWADVSTPCCCCTMQCTSGRVLCFEYCAQSVVCLLSARRYQQLACWNCSLFFLNSSLVSASVSFPYYICCTMCAWMRLLCSRGPWPMKVVHDDDMHCCKVIVAGENRAAVRVCCITACRSLCY